MNRLLIYYTIFFLSCTGVNLYAGDTLFITKTHDKINIYRNLSILDDTTERLNINDILNKKESLPFYKNVEPKLNFKFSGSTYWLRLTVKNNSRQPINYLLEISNPDLDYINFYELSDGQILRSIQTGELLDVKSREIYNRNFLFHIALDSGIVRTYYLSVNNNSHACSIPVSLMERSYFEGFNNKTDAFNWSIYGLLIFIIIFNIYLYRALRDKVNLYYSLSLLFAVITFMHYDGYLYLVNPSHIIENLKWINPGLYSVFLLLFTRSFVAGVERYKGINKLINPLIVIVIVVPVAYNLQYPFSLIADIGIPVLVLIAFIFIIKMSLSGLRRDYLPSQLLILAYIMVFLGLLIHQLKEFNIITPNFFTIDAIKIGLTLQNILITIAVLERFRIHQNNDKMTIEENLRRIEVQNRELEIINTELEKLSIVASETDNSIAIYDNGGILEWGNTGFEKLYEVAINDLIKGKKDRIEDIIPNPHIHEYLINCKRTQLPVVFETPVITKNNKEIWVQTTLSPFIRKKTIFKIIAIDSDITSLKNYGRELEIAKEKAEESDRLKTAFLHNISHEIRTPMNAIIGFSGLLNDQNVEAEKRSQYTDIIIQSSNHLLSVINDIMRIASIEAGQENLSESQFDLNTALEYLHEQFWLKAREQNTSLELKVSLPETEIELIADETKLVQVLANLIDNALKFTKKGSVTFGYKIRENELEFFVQDSGIGIAPELHQEIFKRFHQVESTNTRKFGGSGLGLSISKAYVELMGGRIWVASALNQGSVFYFTIPYKKASSKESEPETTEISQPELTNQKTILIAEDEESNFNLLKELLSGLNINIVRAKNGLEAVELCRTRIIDLILMDIKMPQMDGFMATRQIREFLPDLPIIAQTAYNTESDKELAYASGCNSFISKPLKKDVVLSIVNVYLSPLQGSV
jgi:signal transduction histidine kinase/CheY-like chemotaxis protein